MTLDDFATSIETTDAPSADLSPELTALWHAKAGDWETAHSIAQEIDTPLGSHIHAHLHLIEGDHSNAAYWYRKAGRSTRLPKDLPDDWIELVSRALAESEGTRS